MIQDAKAGMTVAEIAKKHGVTYQQCYYTVSEYAQATIKKNKKKQSAATKVRNAAMLEDAKAGMTDKEIAKNTFVSKQCPYRPCRAFTYKFQKLDERRKAILADYEAGTSSKDICEKYGISNPLFTRTCAKLENLSGILSQGAERQDQSKEFRYSKQNRKRGLGQHYCQGIRNL